MCSNILPERSIGVFEIGNVMGWAGETCDIVLEESEDGMTHLWGRLNSYIGMQVIIHASNVNGTEEAKQEKPISFTMMWRAMYLNNGLALADDALKGEIKFGRTTYKTQPPGRLDLMLSGADLGREMWVEGQHLKEHDPETKRILLQEIKQQWKDIR